MKSLLRILVFFSITLVCVPALAENVYGMLFPNDLAGFTLDSVINNEKDMPGQGFSLFYDHPGVKASVFVYDLGIKNIPNGDNSPIVYKAFQQAINDVKTVHHDAQSLDVTPKLSIDGTNMLHAAFQYASDQAGSRDVVFSHVYMTAQNGNFILVRTTYSAIDQPVRGMHVETSFIEALCKALATTGTSKHM